MTASYRVNPGYRYTRETVEITQKITEAQFRAIEQILGWQPQRFKDWAEFFTFEPATPGVARRLRRYLSEQPIAHTSELLQTFAIDKRKPNQSRRQQ
jgi:hypothetical protein